MWALHVGNFRKWGWGNDLQSTRIMNPYSARLNNTADWRNAKAASSSDSPGIPSTAASDSGNCELYGPVCCGGPTFNGALNCFVESRKPAFSEASLFDRFEKHVFARIIRCFLTSTLGEVRWILATFRCGRSPIQHGFFRSPEILWNSPKNPRTSRQNML